MPESTKTFLGNYELLEIIGDGAEGRVYKAICVADNVPKVSPGEPVAVKRFKSTGHDRESQNFLRQIKILSKLNHPNVVRHKDSFVWREKELEEDVYCLVMELLDGEPLKSLIEKNRNGLPWERAKTILFQTLQALQYASTNGVIHRDLKPSNIYITTRGIPKLVDFGIARQDDGEATATGTVAGAKGTFDYMAPDFALLHGGFRGDEQSDIFSFGVIIYYTLTGCLPFPPLGEHAARGYYLRWLGQQPSTVEFRHPIFRVLSHARTCISKCIDLDRKVRFKSFDEVLASFTQIGYRKLKRGSDVYEFHKWLGKGGFGEVFRGRRLSDQRDVAVKRLFTTSHSARFIREAKILHGATHPNLTEYVDFVEVRVFNDEREYYLILEYLDGMPDAGLNDRIKKSDNGLNPTEALKIFVCYLDCLDHLHKNGIIHRDIKPGNLYAPPNNPNKAKIFDLGIAHDEEGTRTHGQVPGTLDFMPPEFAQQSSGRGSAQSDIYSIGVTLYLALTKKLPFPRLAEKEDEMWLAFFQRSEKPLDCPFDHPVFKTHPELVSLVRRAIAHDPKRRFEKAGAMRDEIKRILNGWGTPVNDRSDEPPTAITETTNPLANEKIGPFHARDIPNQEANSHGAGDKNVPEVNGGASPLGILDLKDKKDASGANAQSVIDEKIQVPINARSVRTSGALEYGEPKTSTNPPAILTNCQRLELQNDEGTKIFITNQSTVRIGRHRSCDILARSLNKAGQELRAESLMISQFHAQIDWIDDSCHLKDGGYYPGKGWQQSTAGLWVDGRRVATGGGFDLVQDREYLVALGDPNSEAANPFKLGARLWSARNLPELKPACQDYELSPDTPVCVMLRRLNGPRWVYLILRFCAALAWADSRTGRTCVGLRQGRLHLSDGDVCDPLKSGRGVRTGAISFRVLDMPTAGDWVSSRARVA